MKYSSICQKISPHAAKKLTRHEISTYSVIVVQLIIPLIFFLVECYLFCLYIIPRNKALYVTPENIIYIYIYIYYNLNTSLHLLNIHTVSTGRQRYMKGTLSTTLHRKRFQPTLPRRAAFGDLEKTPK